MSILTELKTFGKFFVDEITTELARKDKKASGKLLKSIRSEVSADASGYEIAVWALDYFKFVDKGVNGRDRNRNSPYSYRNKRPPIDAILEWVKTRALTTGNRDALSAAYAIQNHVFRNGVKGINFLDEFLKTGVDQQLDKLGDIILTDISVKLDKLI